MRNSSFTNFYPDPNLLFKFRECIDDSGIANDFGVEDSVEWPNNMMSRQTVVYSSGVITRKGKQQLHDVEPQELDLCMRLSTEAKVVMGEAEVGMGSESGDSFRQFFVVANIDAIVPNFINEGLIKSVFGGTLFPLATITVEPLEESGVWWSEVLYDSSDMEVEEQEKYLHPWRMLINWFKNQPEFVSTAFVRIGDYEALRGLQEDLWPEGTKLVPCVLPRLAIGMTKNGSVVGLFGFTVQT